MSHDSLLIGMSNSLHQDLLGLGAPGESIRINPSGVDRTFSATAFSRMTVSTWQSTWATPPRSNSQATFPIRRMRDARCLFQHSVTPESKDKEGTPDSVLEAGGSRLPVVATRHAGIPDVVIHEETGLLCEEMDIPGMAANMRFMAENPREAGTMGRAARRRIFERFLLADRLETLVSFLHEAVQDGAP